MTISDKNDKPHALRLPSYNKAERLFWAIATASIKHVLAKLHKIQKKFIVSESWYHHDYQEKLQPLFKVPIGLMVSKQVW